jgi:protein-S-isoprenylcysteine O-methyltransferase Ste14
VPAVTLSRVGIGDEGGAFDAATTTRKDVDMRLRAAAGSVIFLAVAPGVAAGVVPWLLTGWSSSNPPRPLQLAGWIAIGAGATVLLEAFGRFAVEGIGTPAPVAPTEKLVVGGLYRYVRNPMYLAVSAVILGQAAVLGRWELVVYELAFAAAVGSFVHWYEEPALRRRFGAGYDEYLRAVPGWLPRPPRRSA